MKERPFKYQTLIADLETDGLLQELTRIHLLVIIEHETGRKWVFRRNRHEDTILDGIAMLNEAELIVGHNWVGFDGPALWKVYGDAYNPRGKVRDTLVMARMVFADEKERDFRRWRRGELEGKYIGSHELGAWGQRLNFPKDDYAKRKAVELREHHPELSKEQINRLVWAKWNQELEDYAVVDVEVTDLLWGRILRFEWSPEATLIEHRVHALMERVSNNGFPFNQAEAHVLERELREQFDTKTKNAIEHFGSWWVPNKWNKTQLREELGEDDSRAWWGEVVIPKRTVNYTKPGADGKAKGDRVAGCAYCPVKIVEFNPNSRQQIVNRLEKIYGWDHDDREKTEKGNIKVNDEVLRDLAKTVPIAGELAEIFYYNKRLGQLVDGQAGWIGKSEERGDSCIHGRVIVGGTVTNRASHSNPNIAQVPRVVFKKLKQYVEKDVSYRLDGNELVYGIERPDGRFDTNITPLLGPDEKQIIGTPKFEANGDYALDKEGKLVTKKTLMKGRAGDHGWECRNLFTVKPGFILMGSDQKGIELRCLGHFMAEFDGGEYGRLCVEADPHDLHQSVMELDNRDDAKTFIYAMIYGAADYKLGITLDPTLALKPTQAKALGEEMRRRIMTRIPALGQTVTKVQRDARKGFIEGLDGRRLYVRAKHSALNTKLQGAGASISKMWCILFEQYMEETGLVHGWHGDFAMVAWVHDELQVAVRDDDAIIAIARECFHRAAADAGKYFNFRLPVDVEVKPEVGRPKTYRWSETH